MSDDDDEPCVCGTGFTCLARRSLCGICGSPDHDAFEAACR